MKAKDMHRIQDGVFYSGSTRSGWAKKVLYIAGRTKKSGGRWYGRWRWDGWTEAKPGSTYAPTKKKDTKDKKKNNADPLKRMFEMQKEMAKMILTQKQLKAMKAKK